MAAEDVLKTTFRRLKQKTCSLEELVDTLCEKCCSDVLEKVEIAGDPATDYLSDASSWSIYTHSDYQGLYIVKGVFSKPGLDKLLLDTLITYLVERQTADKQTADRQTECEQDRIGEGDVQPQNPTSIPHVRSNLSCLGITCPEGGSYWSTLDEHGNSLINKLRWISMGYHYDWTEREYRPGFRSDFPPELARLARDVAQRLGLCDDLIADAVIVNYYHPGDTLSFHQDELEWDLSKPLISISLGLPGILCVGGTDRQTSLLSVLLTHGDVVVMSGTSRTAYHAVPRVFDSYSVRACQHQHKVDGSDKRGQESPVGRAKKRDKKKGKNEEHAGEGPDFVSDMLKGLEQGQLDDHIAACDRNIEIGVFGETLREFLKRTRINVSIRQVEKHS